MDDDEAGFCAEHNSVCVAQARTEEKLRAVSDCLAQVKTTLGRVEAKVDEIDDKVDKRPSWVSTAAITVLSSVVVGLSVFVLTRL